ncbi:MAG: peptidoglycan-binding domain-containing protein [Myxococcota bacterium]
MTAVRLSPRITASTVRAPARPVRPAVSAPVDGFEAARKSTPAALHRGSTGPAVRALQDRLVKAGALSASDVATGPGVYGPRTEAGVRRFQAAVGLPVTGIAGPETQAALASGTRFLQGVKAPRITEEETQPVSRSQVLARLADTFTEEITEPMGGGL